MFTATPQEARGSQKQGHEKSNAWEWRKFYMRTDKLQASRKYLEFHRIIKCWGQRMLDSSLEHLYFLLITAAPIAVTPFLALTSLLGLAFCLQTF